MDTAMTRCRMISRLYLILKLSNITLVGVSMGGAVSIRYMARHHGHVTKLVLLGAAAPCFSRREDFPYGIDKSAVDDLMLQGTKQEKTF
jgi:non-heme chloroperoxidase